MNIFLLPFNLLLLHMESYINHHIPHNRMMLSKLERRNRHLVETSCTLLLHFNVPLYFFGQHYPCAYYLFNSFLPLSSKSRWPILSCSLIRTSTSSFLGLSTFSNTLVLSVISLHEKQIDCQILEMSFLGYSDVERLPMLLSRT